MTATIDYKTKKCMFCGKSQTLKLPVDGYSKWRSGAFVQSAFPKLSPQERELLITGVDSKCWDANMGDED